MKPLVKIVSYWEAFDKQETDTKMYTFTDIWEDDFYMQCSPDSLFEPDDCVLTDVNLSDAREDNLLESRKNFSYSLASDGDSYPNSPLNDMDSDFPGNLIVNPSDVKVEPLSPHPTHEQLLDIQTELKSEPDIVIKEEPGSYMPKLQTVQTSVLKQPTILISSRPSSISNTRVLYPKLPVKVESDATGWRLSPAKFLVNGNHSPHSLSSINSSSLSHIKSSSRRAIDSHLISSNTGSNGELFLTEEEKRTLISEGYSVPKKLPLSKAEERSLKKIRRKIKNKISAQESRRKKKEYMDTLERKYETIQDERNTWMKKCEELEMQNRELQKQLTELQSQIIDFDEMVSPNPNFNIKTIDAPIETGKAILEIPNPFEIDVD